MEQIWTISGNDGKLLPENELVCYFLAYRYDDLIDALDTMKFKIDVEEHTIIKKVMYENRDEFRSLVKKSVVKAMAGISIGEDENEQVARIRKIMTNRLDLEMVFPTSVHISELNAQEHEGEIVTFEAKVSNWSKIRTITTTADYKCPECDGITEKKFTPKLVEKCSNCGIGRLEFYKPRESEDTRRIILREMVDDFSGGELPYTVTADIYGHTVKKVELSDKLIVTGIFRSIPLIKESGKISQQFIPTIQVISARHMNDESSNILPDEQLLKKFKQLEKEGKLIESTIDGFAYNIYKKRNEKKAVLCSLIGSKWIGQVGKGNPPMIHILFVGDPDTYKSTIMKYISNVYDNCVLADSTTVSNAGIKASAVKMDDGRMSIRAGLMPEYNGGVVFLDEFGDLKQDIYADLKAPMIDGRVSKYVAGEDFNAKAETGILGSMNPIDSVYDNSKTIYDNLEALERALITRFDVIFLFQKTSPDYDSTEIRKHFLKCDLNGKPEEYLTDDEIKMLINYAKTIDPEITQEAIETQNNFFAKLEKLNDEKEKDEEKVEIETRTENAIMKFAVALAKWHMSDKVLPQHVLEAIDLYTASQKTFGLLFKKGEFIKEATLKKSEDGRMMAIKKAYDELKDENGYVFPDELVERIREFKVFRDKDAILTKLESMRLTSKFTEKNKMYKFTWT